MLEFYFGSQMLESLLSSQYTCFLIEVWPMGNGWHLAQKLKRVSPFQQKGTNVKGNLGNTQCW